MQVTAENYMQTLDYQDFLGTKVATAEETGFEVDRQDLHPSTFDHQADTIRWALRGGKRALFLAFGLGKSHCQLEMARLTKERFGGPALIVCPLGIRHEFRREGERLGIETRYVTSDEEAMQANADGRILLTNYERVRDGHISPQAINQLTFASLDEASCLRSFGSKTYQTFLDLFEGVPYRYVATATPSPNRYKELIHYAAFLGIMDSGQALTRFFQRNSEKANDLTIYPHKEKEFWLWCASWGLFLTRPSDLGYSDEGYDLPPLKVEWHEIEVSHENAGADRDGQRRIFRDAVQGLSEAAREKRETMGDRLAVAQDLIEEGGDEKRWLLWHHLERERRAIERSIEGVVSVYGSQDLDAREAALIDFSEGRGPQVLATKPSIAGSGCNFQRHCHANIFLGIDYGFNDFIQAVHRTYRFQQTEEVEVHILYTDSERNVRRILERKWQKHNRLLKKMRRIIEEYGLADAAKAGVLRRKIGVERKVKQGQPDETGAPLWTAVRSDCVEELCRMPDESVGLIHTSIPFSDQYEYTPTYNDFGHNAGDGPFFEQMGYLVPELLRVLQPGRIAAIHVKDRVRFGSVTGLGMPSVSRFSDRTADVFEHHGFIFTGRITVVTDVVRENNQTYRLGWSEQCKDGTKMGCGMSEYVMLFRKLPTDTSDSYADEPVTKSKEEYTRARWQTDAHGHWRSSGNRLLTPQEVAALSVKGAKAWYRQYSRSSVYGYGEHVALAEGIDEYGRLPATFMLFAPESPAPHVWTDVARMDTLNSEQSRRRQEMHVCPLPLDIPRRIINRFSNEGDLVLDPFAGLMTVPVVAVEMGRRGYGVELNEEYWRHGVSYLRGAEADATAPTLFDTVGDDLNQMEVAA